MSVASPIYVGIDFSGDQTQWKPNAQASNVWIAVLEEQAAGLVLVSLQRVQQLPGQGRPFARLAKWLSNGGFSAAAIDAPFSVPWQLFGQGLPNHAALLAAVNQLALNPKRDFPTGKAFINCVTSGIPFQFTKPLRVTECYWRGRGVNIRSPVGAGARPGAPIASACIKLLANSARPIWPWAKSASIPLVEAFPAAQLRHWGLPHAQYNGSEGQANRNTIVTDLLKNRSLQARNAFKKTILAQADALDAVLSCYAARAAVRNQLAVALPPFCAWQLEGWIAVHD